MRGGGISETCSSIPKVLLCSSGQGLEISDRFLAHLPSGSGASVSMKAHLKIFGLGLGQAALCTPSNEIYLNTNFRQNTRVL